MQELQIYYITNDSNDYLPVPYYIGQDSCRSRNNMDNQNNSYGKAFVNMCCNINCHILNGRVAGDLNGKLTCHQYGGSSLVDYGAGSKNLIEKIQFFKVLQLNHLSDHCPISISLSVNKTEKFAHVHDKLLPLPGKFIWDCNSQDNFIKEISSQRVKQQINNYKCTIFNDVECAVDNFNQIIVGSAKKSLKFLQPKSKKIGKNKTKNKKWFDVDAKVLRSKLLGLSRLLDKFPKDGLIRQERFKVNKQYKRLIKFKKKMFREKLCDKLMSLHHSDPKEFWKILKELENIDNPQDKNSKQNNDISASDWLTHFKGLNENPDVIQNVSAIDSEIKDQISELENTNAMMKDLDYNFTEFEISKQIKNLKMGKANGEDLILNEMLKYGAPYIIGAITKLFNDIMKMGKFPVSWNCSYIVPIYKSGDQSNANNYRGIAISSCLSKLFTMCLNNRLAGHLNDNNLENNNQFGFKKNHRTTDNIFILRSMITKYVFNKLKKSKNYLFACFVDFSKAFDTVWRDGLLLKLLKIGIGGNFYSIIKSIYRSTKYSIKLQSGTTELFESNRGVKQGCNLSPQLFNLFIDDISNSIDNFDPVNINLQKLNCIMFADDLLMVSTSSDGLQKFIDTLQNYCDQWKLGINITKTKVMIFNAKGYKLNTEFQFYLYGNQIELVDTYKYLGIIFQCNGKFKNAVSALELKAHRALFKLYKMLWNSNECYSVKLAGKLFDSVVKPVALYGADIWGGFIWENNNKKGKIVSNEKFIQKLFSDKTIFEQLHIKFCKRALNVHRKATNLACRGELGRYPLIVDICTTIIKYYQRLSTGKTKNSFLIESYESSKQMEFDPWYAFVMQLLDVTQMNYLDLPMGNFCDKFNYKLKSISFEFWKKELK